MSVKRYDHDWSQDEYNIIWSFMKEDDCGDYILYSDYTALLARHNALAVEHAALLINHNALVEAVAWERECIFVWEYAPVLNMHAFDEQVAYMNAARAEVDRLIANETSADCKGEG